MIEEQIKFLEALNYSYGVLQGGYLKLLEDGNEAEAKLLEEPLLQMSALIEDVQDDALNEWMAKATKLQAESKSSLEDLRKYSDEIAADIKGAKKVVKGIASVDKAIQKFVKMLG